MVNAVRPPCPKKQQIGPGVAGPKSPTIEHMKNEDHQGKQSDELLIQEDQVDAIENLSDHLLSCGSDLTLMTLKGHLVLEALLNVILARLLHISALPTRPEDGGLGFFQKLVLVQKFVSQNCDSLDAGVFDVISKLNTVRNHLAHNLKKPEEVTRHVIALLECASRKLGRTYSTQGNVSGSLQTCLVQLWKFLYQVRQHLSKRKPG